MTKSTPLIPLNFAVNGLVLALLLGGLLGYLRYWLGFFIIAQGVCLGLLIPWLAIKRNGGQSPGHPGIGRALGLSFLWFMAANAGLAVGFGLAQPWFNPLGWLSRIIDGDTAEFVFGIAANTGFSRGVAMGAQGGFWLILSSIDWAIMFFFLWIMPWDTKGKAQPTDKAAGAAL